MPIFFYDLKWRIIRGFHSLKNIKNVEMTKEIHISPDRNLLDIYCLMLKFECIIRDRIKCMSVPINKGNIRNL